MGSSPHQSLLPPPPAQLPPFRAQCGIAVVVVGFPATPLLTARARVCISAAHSRQELEWALEMFRELRDR